MPGTFTAQTCADGQVSTSQAAIYTSTGLISYVKQVSLYNTHVNTQDITLWIKRSGGTSRKIRRIQLRCNESCFLLDSSETLELSAGDAIEAQTTTASAVDYVVTGVVET